MEPQYDTCLNFDLCTIDNFPVHLTVNQNPAIHIFQTNISPSFIVVLKAVTAMEPAVQGAVFQHNIGGQSPLKIITPTIVYSYRGISMKLFNAVPSALYSVLASPNRVIYSDALDVLYEAYQEGLKIPEAFLT